MRLKRQGKGSHSKARSAKRTTCTVLAGNLERKRARGSTTGTSVSAAGNPSSARGDGLRDRSKSPQLGGTEPRRAPSGGAAGEPTRPASDQSSSDTKTSDPSTIPLSR